MPTTAIINSNNNKKRREGEGEEHWFFDLLRAFHTFMTLWCAPEERHNEPYGIVYRLGMERNVDISLSDCTFHLHCSSLSLSLCISLSLCLCVCFCFDYLFISPIFSFYGVDKLRTQARGPTYLFLATHTVRQPRTSLHQRFPTPRLLYDASNSVIIRWTGGCQCAAATSKCWQLTRPRIASAPLYSSPALPP